MSEAQSKLPSFEGENREFYDGPDTSEYDLYWMSDLEAGDIYHAEAVYVTDLFEKQYDVYDKQGNKTGEKITKYSGSITITNHSSEWKIKGMITLKVGDDSFEALQGSMLYDLVDSLIDYNEPGSAGTFNVLTGSYKEWREHFNHLKEINVEIVERKLNNGNTYNNIRFTKKEHEE